MLQQQTPAEPHSCTQAVASCCSIRAASSPLAYFSKMPSGPIRTGLTPRDLNLLFDSPIGYTKNPLRSISSGPRNFQPNLETTDPGQDSDSDSGKAEQSSITETFLGDPNYTLVETPYQGKGPDLEARKLKNRGPKEGQELLNMDVDRHIPDSGRLLLGGKCEPFVPKHLHTLPYEIRLQIANELSQYDCLNLLTTNKAMYESTLPRIYQNVVVDQKYDQFSKEYDFRSPPESGSSSYCSCSYINSAYNFTKFIVRYNELSEKWKGDFFPYIRRLQVVHLPDSINTYDHELNALLGVFFGNLVHLRELVWLNDNFKLEFLEMLPDSQSVTTLVLNIKFSNYLSELSTPESEDEYEDDDAQFSLDSHSSCTAKCLSFPNLRCFQIRPFQNSSRLIRIINNLLVSSNPRRISENLKTLKLSRLDTDMTVLLPPAEDLIITARNWNSSAFNDVDLGTVDAVFAKSKLQYLSTLTTLSFNNCLVQPSDGQSLIESCNLGNLRHLALKNVSEYQVHRGMVPEAAPGEYMVPGFLSHIAPHLKAVRHLLVDYREAYVDTVPEFLNSLASHSLESLDVTIRYNHTKEQSCTLGDLYEQYSEAMVSNGKHQTIRRVAVEIKTENAFCDLNIPVEGPSFYLQLARCKKLQTLRISPSDATGRTNALVKLIMELPVLSKLDVFGARAGGAPHLGLGLVHPTLYDEWFKVQHVAMVYLAGNSGLRYIRINKCLFDCVGGEVNPRDAIDGWFEREVRVGCEI